MKTRTRAIDQIVVQAHTAARHAGVLRYHDMELPCALGRSGIAAVKSEGDGYTPAGVWPMRRVLYRADKIANLVCRLPIAPIDPTDGWCDDPDDPLYNQPVKLPYDASHERMWRDDSLYDVVAILGHNDNPVVPGAGSAIFFHIASTDYQPTEGCIAIAREHMLELLKSCDTNIVIDVRL